MKILYCTTVLPSQRRTGGEIASQSFIDALRRAGHSVSVLGYRRPDETKPLGIDEVSVGSRPIESDSAGARSAVWMLSALVSGRPYSCEKYVSRAYSKALRSSIASTSRCVVILDHAQVAFLANCLPPDIPTVFVAHNVEAELYRSQVELQPSSLRRWLFRREAGLIDALEVRLASRASQTWVLTEHDAFAFRKKVDAAKVIRCDLPGLADTTEASREIDLTWDVGLIGTWTWNANAQGLRWFMDHVVPLLPKTVRVAVAGKGSEGITHAPVDSLGFVPDAMEFMRSCRVVCIPSTAGGGVQIKTIDAIASGRPIVATSVALRGIETPPATVTVGDQPETFAKLVAHSIAQDGESSAKAIEWARERRERFDLQTKILINQFSVE